MLLVLVVTLARGSSNSESDLNSVVQKMERAQAAVTIPNHIKRDYRLSRVNNAKVDSEVIAEIDFRSPGKYSVERRSGSSVGAQVVKRIVEHEVEVGTSSQKSRSAAVTRENYLFTYLGEAVLDGQSYYLLHLDPRRKQPELISGRAWIDKQSFLIRRLEGTVKSPSLWVKKIHVQFDFDGSKGMWVLSNMEAVADVRFLGLRRLTSQVMNYEATSVVAVKTRTAAPSIAAVLLK
ncbi:MAG: hypothetical protein ACLPHP_15355 [Candidatus Sulfotelmatobacter sp.]